MNIIMNKQVERTEEQNVPKAF